MHLSRATMLRVLQATFSVGVVAYLLRLVDWQTIGHLLESGTLASLWPGPLISILGLVFAAERWQAILAFFKLHLRRSDAFILYLIGNFYSVLLPGLLGGDVVRAGMCRVRINAKLAPVLASVAIERGLGLWGITLIGSIGSIAVLLLMPGQFENMSLVLSPIMAVSIPLMILLTHGLGQRVGGTKEPGNILTKGLIAIRGSIKKLIELPLPLTIQTLLLSTTVQATEIIIYFYFGRILEIDIPFVFYMFAIPLVYIATVLPISLGGIGVREGVLTWLLSLTGAPVSNAVLLAFLVYLNRVVIGVIGGLTQAVYKVRAD